MKPWIIILLIIIVIAAVGGAAYLGSRSGQVDTSNGPQKPQTVGLTRGKVQRTVTAPGQAVGTKEVMLGMAVNGQLAEVNVRPGSVVKAGDLLARLKTDPFVNALDEATLRLTQAQAEHERNLAEAQLNRQIIESRLRQTEASAPNMAAGEAHLTAAQAELQATLIPPNSDQLTIAAANLRRAEIALQQAQGDYDRIAYSSDVGGSSEALQLQEATLQYETAVAEYNLATRGPTEAAITAARAQVQQAQADYDRLKFEAWSNERDIVVRQAQLQQAIINQEWLEAGIDPFLERDVQQAENNLAATRLVAPFDGVVLEVLARPGEIGGPGLPLILLADPAAVEVRTTVIEEDLPFVDLGQPAEIFFDAEPAEAIQGRVTRIVPRRIQGENRPLYYVYLAPETVPERIVAGMTADASIIVAQSSDVLRLPRALVRAGSSNTAQVRVWTNGQEEARQIEVGLRGDIYIEIIGGLGEGEEIVGE